MSTRKRCREDLNIKVASGKSLHADSLLVRSLCDSARGLPAAADVWDVSGLLLDGQPFSRETVSCWISCVYSLADGLTQLSQQDIEQLSTVSGLTQVLAFANAVGSSVGPLNAACSQLQHLKFMLQFPEQPIGVELPLAGYTYWFSDERQLQRMHLHERMDVGEPLASDEQTYDVRQQVAKQTSSLLHLAHVLRLQPLLDLLHQFLLLNAEMPSGFLCGLLTGVMGLVFSDAVLEAALGSSTLSKEDYVSSVLSQPFSFTPGAIGHSSLLKPFGPKTYDAGTDVLKFDAQLLQDFAGAKAGKVVKVEIDLFGDSCGEAMLSLESTSNEDHALTLPVQLLLGSKFSNAAALEDYLTAKPPTPPAQ
jgi:hypothetical protein